MSEKEIISRELVERKVGISDFVRYLKQTHGDLLTPDRKVIVETDQSPTDSQADQKIIVVKQ